MTLFGIILPTIRLKVYTSWGLMNPAAKSGFWVQGLGLRAGGGRRAERASSLGSINLKGLGFRTWVVVKSMVPFWVP